MTKPTTTTRRIIGLGLGLGMILGLSGPATAAKRKAKPVKVMQDATGDAGNQDSGIPGFDHLGVDLESATIFASGKNLEFAVTHTMMPPTGSFPEAARFLWHFTVDDEMWRFTVKSVDIGKPDVIAQSGTERVGTVATAGQFRLEQCAEDPSLPITLINCNTVETLEGSFDVASATFTVVLPMSVVKAKPKSTIGGGTFWSASSGCQICWVTHLAERSLTATTIIDSAAQSKTYVVPK